MTTPSASHPTFHITVKFEGVPVAETNFGAAGRAGAGSRSESKYARTLGTGGSPIGSATRTADSPAELTATAGVGDAKGETAIDVTFCPDGRPSRLIRVVASHVCRPIP